MKSHPVIVIGMHRSGTSMITDILEKLGLFMGKHQNAMQEARFFLNINKWVLEFCGGSWIYPQAIETLYRDPHAYRQIVEYIQFVTRSPRVANYLGWPNYLRYRTPENMPEKWGWKDPRNTYTLPLWLHLYPEARVIHIYRNGVDVAASLRVRSQKLVQDYFSRWHAARRRWRYNLLPNNPSYNASLLTLDEGFRLWEAYTRRADEALAALPEARMRGIRYETFLQNPIPILQDLCEFVGLAASQTRLVEVAQMVDASRNNAYLQDTELQAFYESVQESEQMVKGGYVKRRNSAT